MLDCHTAKATTAKLRRLWAETANAALEETGDDGYAVRAANSAVKKAVAQDDGDRR